MTESTDGTAVQTAVPEAPRGRRGRRRVDVPELVAGARDGDARSVARLISLVEDASPALRDGAGALAREGLEPADIDLFEINEAFASVVLQSTKELGVDPEKVNVNGGAIALGHPSGMSGARIGLHLALELGRRGGGVGAAALCGGGGQGDALILHVPARS